MPLPFNGVTVSFTGEGSQSATTLAVRSHSESGNDRPDVDVTTSADVRRVVLPGYAAPQKHSFEVVVEAAQRATVLGWSTECGVGELLVQYQWCGDAQPTTLIQESAWVTGVTWSGDLDGVYTATLEFTVDHS
jgi:hypothetical protein